MCQKRSALVVFSVFVISLYFYTCYLQYIILFPDEIQQSTQTFQSFVNNYPQWNCQKKSSSCYVAIMDEEIYKAGLNNTLVQVVQSGGTCWTNAITVEQNYLVKRVIGNSPLRDVREVIWETYSYFTMFMDIFLFSEGSAAGNFSYVLTPGSKTGFVQADNISPAFLQKFGPIVLTTLVWSSLRDPSVFSYSLDHTSKETPKPIGGHAMLLIGVRKTVNDTFFLLQNWWPQKQFFEVSADYLQLFYPKFQYAETKQNYTAEKFEVVYRHVPSLTKLFLVLSVGKCLLIFFFYRSFPALVVDLLFTITTSFLIFPSSLLFFVKVIIFLVTVFADQTVSVTSEYLLFLISLLIFLLGYHLESILEFILNHIMMLLILGVIAVFGTLLVAMVIVVAKSPKERSRSRIAPVIFALLTFCIALAQHATSSDAVSDSGSGSGSSSSSEGGSREPRRHSVSRSRTPPL